MLYGLLGPMLAKLLEFSDDDTFSLLSGWSRQEDIAVLGVRQFSPRDSRDEVVN